MRVKLYCSSIYEAELWALTLPVLRPSALCKALRSILQLPYNSHSYFLPIPLPAYDEICKRSMKFIAITLVSPSLLVQSIANYCVMFGRYGLFLGTNALLCYDRYNWLLSAIISNLEHNRYFSFKCWHYNGLSDIQKTSVCSLSVLIAIDLDMENYSCLGDIINNKNNCPT